MGLTLGSSADQRDRGDGYVRAEELPEQFNFQRTHPADIFDGQPEILAHYTPEAAALIEERLAIVTAIARFVSEDYDIPVILNQPGQGWHWDFGSNVIRIDPDDLLQQTDEFVRFVTAHEGAHRRITRVDTVPEETWNEPGYAFMTNALEDPRINNFLMDSFAVFQEYSAYVYAAAKIVEDDIAEKAQQDLGYTPRFIQGGFEYIRKWFEERQGVDPTVDPALDDLVKEVINNTYPDATKSWHHYPLYDELGSTDEVLKKYSAAANKINLEDVWPEFKRLVEEDLKDQRVQELLDELQSDRNSEDPQHDVEGQLGNQETTELGEILDEFKESAVPLDQMSDELKEQLQDYIDGLSEEDKKRLEEKAKEALKDLEGQAKDALDEALQISADAGMGIPSKGEGQEGDSNQDGDPESEDGAKGNGRATPSEVQAQMEQARSEIRYRNALNDVLDNIVELEHTLKQLFKEREKNRPKPQNRSGTSVDIRTRIKEVAEGLGPVESKAWKRKNAPRQRDYAITLLVDLTGSMQGEDIRETFKAVVAVLEPLDALGIRVEVIGFNSRMNVYKDFKEPLSDEVRRGLGGMIEETHSGAAMHTDDGWALKEASNRLARQKAKRKFIIMCTDGYSNPSYPHSGPEYELSHVIDEIRNGSDQKLVALGLGPHTQFVERAYPNSKSKIRVEDLPEVLSDLLKEILSDDSRFER